MDEFIKELQKEADISTCSPEVQKGIRWLEKEMKFDRPKLMRELKKSEKELHTLRVLEKKIGTIEEQLKKTENKQLRKELRLLNEKLKRLREKKSIYFIEQDIKDRKSRLRARYVCKDAGVFYALSKINSPLVKDYILASQKKYFWYQEEEEEDNLDYELLDDPHKLWYLARLGITDNEYLEKYLKLHRSQQTIEGRYPSYSYHTRTLRVLVLLDPTSEYTDMAIKYFLDNWKQDANYDTGALSLGILTLTEFNYFEYKEEVGEITEYLKNKQSQEGFWGMYSKVEETSKAKVEETSKGIQALSHVCTSNDKSLVKAIKWLKKGQKNNGSWENNSRTTADALLALMAAGEGSKVSLGRIEPKLRELKQSLDTIKPHFVHTSPLYDQKIHVKQLHDKILEMLQSAEKEIRISSLYIDMLYEEIINLVENKPELDVKILTRPKKDVTGLRGRIGKNVIHLLEISTKGNLRELDILHSRLIIIDDKEALISSADLTREQLIDEFNAGIYTKDKETVQKAIKFFDNIWSHSTNEKQKQEAKKN